MQETVLTMTTMFTTTHPRQPEPDVLAWLNRIQAEYREMPGLSLTKPQMRRLWGVEAHVCEALVESLVAARVLRCTRRGNYVACN